LVHWYCSFYLKIIYNKKKNKRDIIRAILYKTKITFKNNESGNLLQIRGDTEIFKLGLRVLFFILAYSILLILLSFRVLNKSPSIFGIFLVIYAFVYIIVLYIIFPMIRLIGLNKGQSYWRYIFIKSSYPTTSDLRFDTISNLLFYFMIYNIFFKPNSYSLLFFYLLVLFLFLVLLPFMAGLMEGIIFPGEKEIRPLEYIIFNDRDKDKSVIIKVWTGSGIFEGEIENIKDELVISPLNGLPTDNDIHIRWESIQAFEVIEKQYERIREISDSYEKASQQSRKEHKFRIWLLGKLRKGKNPKT